MDEQPPKKQRKTYAEIRAEIQTGDLIAFGDNSEAAELLKWISRYPVTSVGIALSVDAYALLGDRETNPDGSSPPSPQIKLILETAGHNLVQLSRLKTRITESGGEVWHLPLTRDVRNKLHNKIDVTQLIHAFESRASSGQMTVIESLISTLGTQSGNLGALVERFHGSTLFALLLDQAGILNAEKPVDQITNTDVCRMALYHTTYTQLQGDLSIVLDGYTNSQEYLFIPNQ